MRVTYAIGKVFGRVLTRLVRLLALSGVHPNALTLIGLVVSGGAAWILASGEFRYAGLAILCAAVFDLTDGAVARDAKKATRFGAFLDSVMDRYSDLILLTGLLVHYARIDRFSYIVLTAIVMIGSVLVSYSRARAENLIDSCKVGFLERPERVVLLIIGALFNRMAPVLWVMAILSNVTVIQRIVHTWKESSPGAASSESVSDGDAAAESVGRADLEEDYRSV